MIARVRVSREMARTFGAKPPHFAAPDAATRARLRAIIAEKERLLPQLDPAAREGTSRSTCRTSCARRASHSTTGGWRRRKRGSSAPARR